MVLWQLDFSVLQFNPDRVARGLADVADLVKAGITPVGGADLPLVADPWAVRQDARFERVFGEAHADALQVAMRLLLSARGNARFEDADELVVDDQLVVLGDDLEDVEIVALRVTQRASTTYREVHAPITAPCESRHESTKARNQKGLSCFRVRGVHVFQHAVHAILIRHTCAGSLPGPGAVRPASQ